jgi:outer membrane biosynthesis protein TonB
MSFLTICISIFVLASLYFFIKDSLSVFSTASKVSNDTETDNTPKEIVKSPKTKIKKSKKEKPPVKFLKEVEKVGKATKPKPSEKTKTTKKIEKVSNSKSTKSLNVDSTPSVKRGRKRK